MKRLQNIICGKKVHKTGDTSWAGTAYPPGACEFTPGLSGVPVTRVSFMCMFCSCLVIQKIHLDFLWFFYFQCKSMVEYILVYSLNFGWKWSCYNSSIICLERTGKSSIICLERTGKSSIICLERIGKILQRNVLRIKGNLIGWMCTWTVFTWKLNHFC